MHRVTPLVLRVAGFGALLLLLWNPASSRRGLGDGPPVVLLDASLSMTAGAQGGEARWRAALDSARAAARGGLVWRFGRRVTAFDSAPPADGASRLGPALEAAAARGGEVVVVTDGELADIATLAPDLAHRPRVIQLPRPTGWDAFVARVDGPTRVTSADTVRLTVHYGTAGRREPGAGSREASLTAFVAGRPIASRRVVVPDSGVLAAELVAAGARLSAGWGVVEVRLVGVQDSEPRDDARLHVLEVSAEPHAVVFAAPPNWDTRFLAAALADVARVPLRVLVASEAGAGGAWRDGRTLAPVGAAEVGRALRAARLVVAAGEQPRPSTPGPAAAVLRWPGARGRPGDWYVEPPPASPIAGALAGIDWSALPPATSLLEAQPDSAQVVVLSATLARRGPPRPVVVLRDSAGRRSATILAEGLWRWQFRGGAAAVAYRALVAALVDWLLGGEQAEPSGERVAPEARVVPNGLPVSWRWAAGEPRDVVLRLDGASGPRTDTLRFGVDGRAELELAPGVYRYALAGGEERGVVAVETYSDEWRPSALTLGSQPGRPGARLLTVGVRDRWWLFALAVAAFVAEWAWRRRQGLP